MRSKGDGLPPCWTWPRIDSRTSNRSPPSRSNSERLARLDVRLAIPFFFQICLNGIPDSINHQGLVYPDVITRRCVCLQPVICSQPGKCRYFLVFSFYPGRTAAYKNCQENSVYQQIFHCSLHVGRLRNPNPADLIVYRTYRRDDSSLQDWLCRSAQGLYSPSTLL